MGRFTSIGIGAGSSHEDDEIRGLWVGSSRDDRACSGAVARSSSLQRGRRPMIARTAGPSHDDRAKGRGRRTMIGRTAGSSHEDDEIRGLWVGLSRDHRVPAPPLRPMIGRRPRPFAPGSHGLRATTPLFVRSSCDGPVPSPDHRATAPLFARSSVGDPAPSLDDRAPAPPLARSSCDDPAVRPGSGTDPATRPDLLFTARLRPVVLHRPRGRDQSAPGAPDDPSTRCPLEAHVKPDAPTDELPAVRRSRASHYSGSGRSSPSALGAAVPFRTASIGPSSASSGGSTAISAARVGAIWRVS